MTRPGQSDVLCARVRGGVMREARARRVLERLLRLYPPAFRWEVGGDLVLTAVERWRDAVREGGRRGAARYWLTEGVRFAVDGVFERARSLAGVAVAEAGHAWRQVRRAPRHYGLAVVTLALGIGTATTIFTVADAVVFRPLPYTHAAELYLINTRFGTLQLSSNSLPNLLDLQGAVPSLSWLAGAADRSPALTEDGQEPERLSVIDVTAAYLPGLGARVLHGRDFVADDYAADAERVLIVSYALWQRRWGGDRALLGRSVQLDDATYTVIGVMSPAFRDPEPIESGTVTSAWAPAPGTSGTYRHRDYYAFQLIGRLAGGSSLDIARQQLAAAGSALAATHPEANRVGDEAMDFVLLPLREATVGDARARLLLLFGAVLLLLVLSCANVAHLFLARGMTRTSELAVRAALGASRVRLGAQLFGESLLTAAVASIAGAALAVYGVQAFLAAAPAGPAGLPRLHEVGIDVRVLGFIVTLTIGTAVFFGSVPAVRGARLAGVATGARSTSSRGTQRFQATLLGFEVALSLVLLTGSALLLNSFSHLLRVEPGFAGDDAVVVDVRPPLSATSHEQALRFYAALMERAAAVPGVSSAALVHTVPGVHGGAWSRVTSDEGVREPQRSQRTTAPAYGFDPGDDFLRLNPVHGDAFGALGMTLTAGRGFTGEPGAGDPLVVVLNEAAARRLFPDVDRPIGRRLALGAPDADAPMREIVGIVGDVRQRGAAREPDPQIYLPYGQRDISRMSLVLKLEPGVALGGDVIRRVVHDVAPGLPLDRVEPLSARYEATSDPSRFLAFLLTAFAALGLVLAAVGTYATAAQTLSRRIRELGVRVALGARAADVFRLVLARALLTVGAGIGVGVLLAVVLARFVESYVFGIGARDPLTFAAAAALLGVSAVVASLGPALRAARVDPNAVLRPD